MVYNKKPAEVRITVQNYLKQSEDNAQLTYRNVDKFHNLLTDVAARFSKAFKLGLKPRVSVDNGNSTVVLTLMYMRILEYT